MTISEEQSRYVYTGTYKAGDILPIPFSYAEKEDVHVEAGGEEWEINVNYAVSGQNVICISEAPAGADVVVYRDTPLNNEADFPQEAEFDSAKISDALDKLTMQNQEQEDDLLRAIKFPKGYTGDMTKITFPLPEANKSIQWNSNGTNLVNSSYSIDDALNLAQGFAERAEDSADSAAKSVEEIQKLEETTKNWASTSRSWAIGDIAEQPEGSAKYWANQTAQKVEGTYYTRLETDSLVNLCSPEIVVGDYLKYTAGTTTGATYTNSDSKIGVTLKKGWYGAPSSYGGMMAVLKEGAFVDLSSGVDLSSYVTDDSTTITTPIAIGLDPQYSPVAQEFKASVAGASGEFPITDQNRDSGYHIIGNATFEKGDPVWALTGFTQTVNYIPELTLDLNAKTFTTKEWSALTDAEKASYPLAFVTEDE